MLVHHDGAKLQRWQRGCSRASPTEESLLLFSSVYLSWWRQVLCRVFLTECALQATDFLFQLFAAAVVSWSDHIMPLLFGIRVQWFPWQPDPKPQALTHGLYGEESSVDGALSQCLLAMSHSLPRLLDKEPWSSQTPKVSVCAVNFEL